MDREKKKALREQYSNRHPKKGIICWQCGEVMWIDMSKLCGVTVRTVQYYDTRGILFRSGLEIEVAA